MAAKPRIPLPRRFTRTLHSAILAAEALHRVALQRVRAGFERALDPRARLIAEVDRLRDLVALRDEELRILRTRIAAISPRTRPHYPPHERFAILSLRARTGWTVADVARRFLVTAATIAGWTRRIDEHGKDALVKPRAPVNRHSDRVALLVKKLHAQAPQLGKRKVAAVLARAGLVLAASTVQRLRKRRLTPSAPPSPPRSRNSASGNVVRAKHAHHLWHVDITTIAGTGGLSLPWWPFALFTIWPFAWHVAVVVDHYSRAFVAFAVVAREPSARDICRLLDRARAAAGRAPRHIVTDQGMQFRGKYLAWCEKHGAAPRFGAIGKHGSIAVIERFIRSLKQEHLRRVLISLSRARLEAQIVSYQRWYNEHRPHQTLGGQTPREKLGGKKPRPRRLEPRPRYPIPREEKRVRRCDDIELIVRHVDAHRHLPIIELRASA